MELQDQFATIEASGGQVVAASTDPLATSKSLASQLHLGFPIVEDRDHRLGSAFDIVNLASGMNMGPVDNHSIFVLDATGRVAWRQLAADTMHVPLDQVVAAVKAA